MFHRIETVLKGGLGVPGAQVTVYATGTTSKASLFSDNAGTVPIANPVTTDANGEYSYFVANGIYDEKLTYGSIVDTQTYVQMFDLGAVTAPNWGSIGGTLSAQADLAAALAAKAAAAPNIQSVASAATVTPTFSNDQVNITAQAAGLTLANPTGTPVDGWGLAIRIKDNGTARSIAYGTQYRAVGVTLPTTTVLGKTLYLGMIYNAADTKWDVVAVAQEA